MDCPKCNSVKEVKDGNINGKQGYLCKKCGHRYMVKKRSTRGMSFELYAEY